MPRSFNISDLAKAFDNVNWREPLTMIRAGIGALAVMNLVAAAFAFHLFNASPEDARRELESARAAVGAQRVQLVRTRAIVGKVEKGRAEGDQFMISSMTPRRITYSMILTELQQAAENSGMSLKESTLAPLDPIKGSDDLSMMTITSSFEGAYPNLLKFINALDRSQRFLIIESLAAAPQPTGGKLNATIKVNTFVRQDNGDAI